MSQFQYNTNTSSSSSAANMSASVQDLDTLPDASRPETTPPLSNKQKLRAIYYSNYRNRAMTLIKQREETLMKTVNAKLRPVGHFHKLDVKNFDASQFNDAMREEINKNIHDTLVRWKVGHYATKLVQIDLELDTIGAEFENKIRDDHQKWLNDYQTTLEATNEGHLKEKRRKDLGTLTDKARKIADENVADFNNELLNLRLLGSHTVSEVKASHKNAKANIAMWAKYVPYEVNAVFKKYTKFVPFSNLEKEEKQQSKDTKTGQKSQGKRQRKQRQRKRFPASPTPQYEDGLKSESISTTSKPEVFANNISGIDIPNKILNFLELGSNFQLSGPLKIKNLKTTWTESTSRLLSAAKETQSEIRSKPSNQLEILAKLCLINGLVIEKRFNQYKRRNAPLLKRANEAEIVFRYLIDNKLIVVPADKNFGLTICTFNWYDIEMRKLLENRDIFKQTSIPTFNAIKTRIKNIIYGFTKNLYERNRLSIELNKKLVPSGLEFPVPEIYGLPKLHKKPVVLRPITPCHSWITTMASQYLAKEWQYYVDKIDTVIPNSQTLSKYFYENSTARRDSFLATYDIKDMYTNINHRDAAVKIQVFLCSKYRSLRKDFAHQKLKFQLNVMEWIMTNSWVQYNNGYYHQVKGLAMGTPAAPVIANLYCAAVEALMNASYGLHYSLHLKWFRYLDDILIIADDEQWLDHFVKNYTIVASPSTLRLIRGDIGHNVKFLDLEIIHFQSYLGLYMVKPFDKPNNRHIYTDPDTFYPWHYIYGWLQGENIRLIRASSYRDDWLSARLQFVNFLKRRNYDEKLIKEILDKNDHNERAKFLHTKEREADNNIYLTISNTPERPMITRLFREVKNDWSMVMKDNNLDNIIPVVTKGTSIMATMNKARRKVINNIGK